jgi:iron complex outermembrane receptor protein
MNNAEALRSRAPFERALLALLAALWGGGAQAQDKPASITTDQSNTTLAEVVITGSRIARPEYDRLQPTTVIDSSTFDKRGYGDVAAALNESPAFGVSPSSAEGQQGNFGIAQNFVDLYSLGSQRTLVLVDGHRFVSSNTPAFGGTNQSPGQQVDLSVIPTKLIDHIETVSVGGAPIYGADAVAGTVNIILKHNYEGLDIDAQTGISNDGDAKNDRVRVLGGFNFADGRGNITSVAEFSTAAGLTGLQRPVFANNLQFEAPLTPGKYSTVLTPNANVASVSTSGIPLVDDVLFDPSAGLNPKQVGVTNAAGQVLAFSPGSSQLSPYNLGNQTGNPIFWQGGDGVDLAAFSNLLASTERINVDSLGNFKINDHLGLNTEGWFSETHGQNLIAQPAYNTALFGTAGTANGNFIVPINNPYLSSGDRTLIQNALNTYQATLPLGSLQFAGWNPNQFYLSRGNTDLENGGATANQVLARGLLGLNGDFEVLDRNYTWDVSATYGSSRNISYEPAYVFQNVENALNATTNAAGQIVCAGTPVAAPVSTGSSTCAPLNLFGQGSPSAAAKAYITHLATAYTLNTQRDVTGNLSGDIVQLPAGEWKFAAGYENRREAAYFAPDTFFTGNYGQLSATAIEGAYHTNEVYAETLIPIIEPKLDLPALYQVEAEGAVRRVDNSIAGKATTWTAGLRWSPIEDLQFRGNRTTSIRAPAITELFLPAATAFEFSNDPCDKNFVGQGTAPATRAANCAAAGINTTTFVSNVVNATAKGLTSGNTGLSSETAESKTVGIVLRPHWVPKLNVTVDYIEINLTNAIEQLDLQELMDACYDSSNYPNNPSCSAFTRNAEHQVTSFHDGFVNAGLLDFQGITGAVDYTFDLPASLGAMQWRAAYLDTRKLTEKIGTASTNILAGELVSPTLSAVPKRKGTLSADYNKGPFDWYWLAHFIGSVNFNNQNTPTTQDISRVNPWWVFDSTISYTPIKNFTVRLIVDNVFDKEPPFPALAGAGGNFTAATTLYFEGIIGRTYLLNADYKF